MSSLLRMNNSLLERDGNTVESMLSDIAKLFHEGQLVSYLSTQVLIACNNYTPAGKEQSGSITNSINATKDLAARAFARLKYRSENQAIVFYGESGSGKTTLRSHLLSSILAHSSTPLSAKLSYAAYIFDTLTTTRTKLTPTASKSGLFYELQYEVHDSDPKLVGGKLLDHRLERSRVTDSSHSEYNYHVFYYLINGVSDSERQYLKFPPADKAGAAACASRWRYLEYGSNFTSSCEADAQAFSQFKRALVKVGLEQYIVANICRLLASILYLGQLRFTRARCTQAAGNESGGYGQEGGESILIVENTEILDLVAPFLGLTSQSLLTSLSYKSKSLASQRVTVLLDPKGAQANADELARTLYALLVAYIMETINQLLCAGESDFSNTISIVDFPGPSTVSSSTSTIDVLLTNTANECLYNLCIKTYYDDLHETLMQQEIVVPATEYFANTHTVDILCKDKCLLTILDDCMKDGSTDAIFLDTLGEFYAKKHALLPEDQQGYRALLVESSSTTLPGSNFATINKSAKFTINHFHSPVDYYIDGILESNGELISSDIANLISTSSDEFVKQLFDQEALKTMHHKADRSTILQASISSKPMRQPSLMRRGKPFSPISGRSSDETARSKPKGSIVRSQGAARQYLTALENISNILSSPDTNSYFYFCLRSNNKRQYQNFEPRTVREQVGNFGLPELRQRLRVANLNIFIDYDRFLSQYPNLPLLAGGVQQDAANHVFQTKGWPDNEARAGFSGVFLSERLWFEWSGHSISPLGSPRALPEARGYGSHDGIDGDAKSHLLANSGSTTPAFDDKQRYPLDNRSDAGLSALNGDMFRDMESAHELTEKVAESKMQEIDTQRVSASRKRWLFMVWLLTWFIPDFLVKMMNKKLRKDDIRMAWREKVAINFLIWLACALVVFFMVGFPALICPKQHVFSSAELSSHNGKDGNSAYVAIRGIVYDLSAFAPVHYPKIIPRSSLLKYAGMDITNLFPVQVSALCNGVSGQIDPAVQLDYKLYNYTGSPTAVSTTDRNAKYHDFRWATNDSRPDWWWEQQIYLKANYQKGRVGFTPKYISTLGSKGNAIAILYNRVYDFTAYVPGGRAPQYPEGYDIPSTKPDSDFMDSSVVSLFSQRSGSDITKYWEALRMDPALRTRMTTCLNNLFYVGDVDTRSSTKCMFSKYLLLVISIFLVSVIGFKFLSALQFGKKNTPENLDKFVICTVPAYTEDEESLRRAIDSAARMKYDDKRKLLFIICDGMIVGEGNDRPTPRIVLDILGVSETVDPQPLSFLSLGEGQKQHNMGKVYTGLYEVQGHIVPFLVVVKVGKPSEVGKPGNRGKRDSQMVLMRFLNRVHYNLPMTPMELEMFHQIRNVIGVNPQFYEFLFQIDADTVVAPDSATRLIAAFMHDTRIIGLCGETALTNAKNSFVTMMQVYEYYISHNLTKAFESLFGSVTCLPGCFSMYRIRDAETGKPLFVSKEVVDAYSEIRVDTLHMKNLLHLGEDRYLTTLLLKFHSKYKTKYIFRAHAWTIAPDSWSIFMSQRRRWINSTVHNLIELIPLTQLCGFCCFSMRFVVFLDLLSTIVQPVIVGYIAYLIYLIVSDSSVLPITAFILLGAIYGLQAIIFIMRRKWEMIGWMIIYILATPIFAFGLPLYSFWHMDDFSWGNTRIVVGEKGQKIVISDEGKFDPASIPVKKWDEYEQELMNHLTENEPYPFDTRSAISGFSQAKSGLGYGGSVYNLAPLGTNPYDNGNTSESNLLQMSGSRPHSHLDLGRASFMGSSFGPLGQDVELSSMSGGEGQPTNREITAALENIFASLGPLAGNFTRRQIRQELFSCFPVSLAHRKAYIDSEISRLGAALPPP